MMLPLSGTFHSNILLSIHFIFLLTTYSPHRNLSFNSQINMLLLNNCTSGLFNLIYFSPYFTGQFVSKISSWYYFPLCFSTSFFTFVLFFLAYFSPTSFSFSWFPFLGLISLPVLVLQFCASPYLTYCFFTHCSALNICICLRL